MPVPNITVSLSEVLEVRGSPLTETEIWALLCQGAELLQDLFITGKIEINVEVIKLSHAEFLKLTRPSWYMYMY